MEASSIYIHEMSKVQCGSCSVRGHFAAKPELAKIFIENLQYNGTESWNAEVIPLHTQKWE
jgi:hypothetical protein